MANATSDWEDQLERWLKPFRDRLGHKARRRMCPRYIAGLIGPGERKSIQPMAERFAAGDYDQLHHFIADGVWDATLLETELLKEADRLVGGDDAVLAIDDTAVPNAHGEVPVMIEYRTPRSKPEIALAEIDRAMAAGVRFGCVLADAGYGLSAPFRQGLTARGLTWAVGVPRHLKVYPFGVKLIWPVAMRAAPASDTFRTFCRGQPKTWSPIQSGKL
ncbi:transposase [Bradyrhizobium sp. 186]|uniref:transposase n=1 Tax=Bradyrhizobium sp. 186 TaxID=2782654 RepID=UPI0020010D27|nr:transposase [Bradyrhizobium sp. 186]